MSFKHDWLLDLRAASFFLPTTHDKKFDEPLFFSLHFLPPYCALISSLTWDYWLVKECMCAHIKGSFGQKEIRQYTQVMHTILWEREKICQTATTTSHEALFLQMASCTLEPLRISPARMPSSTEITSGQSRTTWDTWTVSHSFYYYYPRFLSSSETFPISATIIAAHFFTGKCSKPRRRSRAFSGKYLCFTSIDRSKWMQL